MYINVKNLFRIDFQVSFSFRVDPTGKMKMDGSTFEDLDMGHHKAGGIPSRRGRSGKNLQLRVLRNRCSSGGVRWCREIRKTGKTIFKPSEHLMILVV